MKKLDLNQMGVLSGGACNNDVHGNSCFGHCGAVFLASIYAGENFPFSPVIC